MPGNLLSESCGLRILRALRRIVRAVDVHSRRLNSEYHTTVPQMLCLYTLVQEGEMTLFALARHVNLGVSTVNGIIDRLEAKGLVQRVRSTQDRRKVFIHATEDGSSLAQAAPSLLQERFACALRNLPDLEQAAIALSLERLVELMDNERLDHPADIPAATADTDQDRSDTYDSHRATAEPHPEEANPLHS